MTKPRSKRKVPPKRGVLGTAGADSVPAGDDDHEVIVAIPEAMPPETPVNKEARPAVYLDKDGRRVPIDIPELRPTFPPITPVFRKCGDCECFTDKLHGTGVCKRHPSPVTKQAADGCCDGVAKSPEAPAADEQITEQEAFARQGLADWEGLKKELDDA